ncbi:exosome complex exonuclease rrp42 [Anopheles darlingi]|uniref:Ribosomal RNA-processing protein 42 n=1 Tax=Anopheles darlingi TaxID=43151 RepID=W5JFK5_ANODA|nr:exosome complex component RRP42 [Anopheles darlingi]ETN62123.1 exosome complex exonuclease rrp42 [Anopheles darlingi]
MANILLSEAEKTYILHGIQKNYRNDGRSNRDYRPMELELDIVVHASGSARLRLANTDILVGVKAEIDTPHPDRPNEGKIDFFIDCSANAAPEFEGRGGEQLAEEISNTLAKAYESQHGFDLSSLCILANHQCWKLYVDVLVLECGGNLFDAISLAVKGALYNTRVPRVSTAMLDGGSMDLILTDDPFDCERLKVDTVPLLVTVCKIGEQCVVDPSAEEEECSAVSVVVGVSCRPEGKQSITTVRTSGEGSIHMDTLQKCFDLAASAASSLNSALTSAMKEDEKRNSTAQGKRKIFGFLK